MKYRAVLHDPAATRETKPEQAFSNNPVELEEWAIQTLGRLLNPAPGVEVLIFRTIEKPFRTVPHQTALEIIDQRAQAEAVAATAANAKKVGFPARADQS